MGKKLLCGASLQSALRGHENGTGNVVNPERDLLEDRKRSIGAREELQEERRVDRVCEGQALRLARYQ